MCVVIEEMDPAFNYWALQVWLAAVAVMEFLSDLLFGYTYTRGWRGEREAARRDYSRSTSINRNYTFYGKFSSDNLGTVLHATLKGRRSWLQWSGSPTTRRS